MFEFDDINPIINLDLPKDPVSGWTMKLLNTDQVSQYQSKQQRLFSNGFGFSN